MYRSGVVTRDTLRVTLQVDAPGTLGRAGAQKGDAVLTSELIGVLAINGQDIENYADLKVASL